MDAEKGNDLIPLVPVVHRLSRIEAKLLIAGWQKMRHRATVRPGLKGQTPGPVQPSTPPAPLSPPQSTGDATDVATWVPTLLPIFGRTRTRHWIPSFRLLLGIQITPEQIECICETLWEHTHPRFLVFGLGNDSGFWAAANHDGETLFLEDVETWYDTVCRRSPELSALRVHYDTVRRDWRELLHQEDRLKMTLPPTVMEQPWDVILVDGPRGYDDGHPGRMQSIFMASLLVRRPKGVVFVHDCERMVERTYSARFLSGGDLFRQVGNLNAYRMRDAPRSPADARQFD